LQHPVHSLVRLTALTYQACIMDELCVMRLAASGRNCLCGSATPERPGQRPGAQRTVLRLIASVSLRAHAASDALSLQWPVPAHAELICMSMARHQRRYMQWINQACIAVRNSAVCINHGLNRSQYSARQVQRTDCNIYRNSTHVCI
jgi:hypothetical protein